MGQELLISLGIGFIGSLLFIIAFPIFRYTLLKSVCNVTINRFLIRVAVNANNKSIYELCSKRMRRQVQNLKEIISPYGQPVSTGNMQILSVKQTDDNTFKTIILYSTIFRKGQMNAQVTIRTKGSRTQIEEFKII